MDDQRLLEVCEQKAVSLADERVWGPLETKLFSFLFILEFAELL